MKPWPDSAQVAAVNVERQVDDVVRGTRDSPMAVELMVPSQARCYSPCTLPVHPDQLPVHNFSLPVQRWRSASSNVKFCQSRLSYEYKVLRRVLRKV